MCIDGGYIHDIILYTIIEANTAFTRALIFGTARHGTLNRARRCVHTRRKRTARWGVACINRTFVPEREIAQAGLTLLSTPVADPGGVRWVRTNPPSVPETVTE